MGYKIKSQKDIYSIYFGWVLEFHVANINKDIYGKKNSIVKLFLILDKSANAFFQAACNCLELIR